MSVVVTDTTELLAALASPPGDKIIQLAPGTYSPDKAGLSAGTGFVLETTDGRGSAILDGLSTYDHAFWWQNGWVFRELTFRNWLKEGAERQSPAAEVYVYDCDFEDMAGGIHWPSVGEILRCRWSNISGRPPVATLNGTGVKIAACDFHSIAGSPVVQLEGGSNLLFSTIARATSGTHNAVTVGVVGAGLQVYGTIFKEFAHAACVSDPSRAHYCVYHRDAGGETALTGTGNVNADPLFVEIDTDRHLQVASPARTLTPSDEGITYDVLGAARLGPNYDAGAYTDPDTDGPTITHDPVVDGQTEAGDVEVSATITDASGVASAALYFRTSGDAGWNSVAMAASGDEYSGTIPGSFVKHPGVEYYIAAIDSSLLSNQSLEPAAGAGDPHEFLVALVGLTPFDVRLGIGQGRVQPGGAAPKTGAYVFVLGDEQGGRSYDFRDGDLAQAVQDVDLTDVDFVRADLTFRVPAAAPDGLSWHAALVVDGIELATATARAGRTRRITDLAANVSKLSGVHTIGVRLVLGTAPVVGGGWMGS